ncbi:MAG: putative oxygen-independent coproporphyrinogen III oxidase HemN [Acidimicrobiia bacterium]
MLHGRRCLGDVDGAGSGPVANLRVTCDHGGVQIGLGVYVHVPFCATRCDYCAFATWTDRAHLVDAYVDACVTDIGRRRASGELDGVTTVYFGGGTPSLLPAAHLVRMLDAIPLAPGAEVTVECNPDSIDRPKLRVYRDHGVTRVSLGVQSTQPHVLAALGRTHDRDNVARAIDAVHGVGFPTFNVDVIAGCGGERAADFDATLADLLGSGAPHMSVYGLTVEPGSPLERRILAGGIAGPDPDTQADRYLRADDLLLAAGLEWYEVSNWAKPGHECRHNLGYWHGAECVAIGAAAHGHLRGARWWNVRTPDRYIDRIAAQESPSAGSETLDPAASAAERFGLALRTRGGAPLIAGIDERALATVVDSGLVRVEGTRIVLTRRGRLLATEVTLRLWPHDDAPRVGAGTRYDGVPIERRSSDPQVSR